MSRYIFDINQPAGLLNPEGGETGASLIYGLNNNCEELYKGSGNIYTIQAEDEIGSVGWWGVKLLSFTTFSIINDFDFGGETLALPEGVVLIFNGGIWSNGVVVGNNTTFISYGEKQCFEVDLTLDGIWDIKFLTPQNYGAVSNGSTSIFSNNASPAIQKCIDSGYPVWFPKGFYYIADAIIFSNASSVYCQDGQCNLIDSVISSPDHVRLYSDQDIYFLDIRSSDVYFSGGIIDVTRIATFSKAAIKLSTGGYNINFVSLKTRINGSLSKLKSGAQTGSGIYCDFDTATGAGSAQYIDIDCIVAFFTKGLNVPSSPIYTRYGGRWKVRGYFAGNKQEIIFNEGSYSDINVFIQAVHVCTEEESENPSIELGASYSTFKSDWPDYGGSESGGFYTNKYYLRNFGTLNFFPELDPIMHVRRAIIWDLQPSYEVKFNPYNVVFKNAIGETQRFNSYLQNNLAYFLKSIPSSTINLYDGEGYDFDTKLDDSSGEGLGAATSMSLTSFSGSNIGEYRTRTPIFRFANELKKETDFCEIVIPWTFDLRAFYIYINESGCRFQRIQVIIKTDTDDLIQNDYTGLLAEDSADRIISVMNDDRFNTAGNISKIIIRFIGGTSIITVAETVTVRDIYVNTSTQYQHVATYPMIDIGGGQTIYGNLAVNDGVKEVDLPVYADNAAAKIGGLVDGDPYRTATGVRMVVYT